MLERNLDVVHQNASILNVCNVVVVTEDANSPVDSPLLSYPSDKDFSTLFGSPFPYLGWDHTALNPGL